jgi:hypothetical protein
MRTGGSFSRPFAFKDQAVAANSGYGPLTLAVFRKTMRKIALLILGLVALPACQNSVAVQREAEIFSSIPFDEVPCGELAARRDRLAATHGLPPNVERQPMEESDTAGFGIVIPDTRGEAARAKARAVGEITAMNRSMARRSCGAN